MCLGVYLASATEIPLTEQSDISVQEVQENERAVTRLLSLPYVRYIGAHTGCSCGFPHVVAEEPIDWYEGFFEDEGADRPRDLASVRALLSLIGQELEKSAEVQIYPVWNGNEAEPSKGTIVRGLSALEPEKFFFNEQFLYRIHK